MYGNLTVCTCNRMVIPEVLRSAVARTTCVRYEFGVRVSIEFVPNSVRLSHGFRVNSLSYGLRLAQKSQLRRIVIVYRGFKPHCYSPVTVAGPGSPSV